MQSGNILKYMAGTKEMSNHTAPENITSPESYILTIPYLTISGRSGTGKSATAETLANKLGVLPENNIKTGVLFREALEKRGIVVEGFAYREEQLDEDLDRKQAELMLTATTEQPRIIEGRLAGVINREIKKRAQQKGQAIPQGISLLFTCEKEVREKRQVDREKTRQHNSSDVIMKNFQRDTGDFSFWQKMHPELLGEKTIEDLYDALDKNNVQFNPLYDIIINTTFNSIEEVTQTILELLIEKGLAKRR